jgi:hypothetical protein
LMRSVPTPVIDPSVRVDARRAAVPDEEVL